MLVHGGGIMTTGTDLAAYYSSLLISQYRWKPKAVATIQADAIPWIMPLAANDNPLLLAIQNAFNLPTAVGVQLDVLGKYIGAKRQQQCFSGPITLDDDTYRELLFVVAQRRTLRADTASIQAFIVNNFGGDIQVVDAFRMQMVYYYKVQPGVNIVAECFIKMGLLPSPLGVDLQLYHESDFFGFEEDPSAYGYGDENNSEVGGHYRIDPPRTNFQTEYFVICSLPNDFGFEEDTDAQGYSDELNPTVGGIFAHEI